MSLRSCSLFLLLTQSLITSESQGSDDWCHDDQRDPYDTALQFSQSANLSRDRFQGLLDETLRRFPCYLGRNDTNDTCTRLPTAEVIFDVLKLTAGVTLDRQLFERASAIVVSYLFRMSTECPVSDANAWNALDEDGHLNYLLQIPGEVGHEATECVDSHGDRCLGSDQLENLLRTISINYVSGTWTHLSRIFVCGQDGLLENTYIRDLNCNFGHTKSFSSEGLWHLLEANETETAENSSHAETGFSRNQLGHLSSVIFTNLLSGDCITEVEEGSSSSEDFIKSIFEKFGDHETCRISNEGFQRMLETLKIGDAKSKDTASKDESDHSHNHRKRRSAQEQEHEHDHDHQETDVATTCLSTKNLLNSFHINSTQLSLTKTDFQRLSPALIQQVTVGCQTQPEAPTSSEKASAASAYGFGTLAVAIVSFCVVFALIIVRWKGSVVYRYLISTMLGLAVGSLAGDALLHLLPEALGAHSDDHGSGDGGIKVEPYVWLALCGCGSLWFYYNLQLFLYKAGSIAGFLARVLGIKKSNSISSSGGHADGDNANVNLNDSNGTFSTDLDNCSISISGKISDMDKMANGSKNDKDKHEHEHLHDHGDGDVIVHSHSSVAWMITIGDGIHNFADGLAMGAAFSTDWQTGIATTIAIFTHELPHEFGDTAVLLSAGWSTKKVLLFQLLSQATAFVGLYIGISVSETTEGAQQWIAAIASGMFLYIALADVIPELIQFFSLYSPFLIFVTSNFGIAVGFLAMVLLAVYEEKISL